MQLAPLITFEAEEDWQGIAMVFQTGSWKVPLPLFPAYSAERNSNSHGQAFLECLSATLTCSQ